MKAFAASLTRNVRRSGGRVLFAASLLLGLSACSSVQEDIQFTAHGKRVPDAEIDKDPWRLLVPGAVAWLRLDAQALFESELGPQFLSIASAKLPFAEGAGVHLERDIDTVMGGVYATVGSDVIFACQGRFDEAAVAAAMKKTPTTQLGHKIVVQSFAGGKMYVANQVAVAILTGKTMVFGTQLGVRRALELVEEGRLKRSTPVWFDALLKTGGADFQLGVDLDSQPVPAAFRSQLEFLSHLRAARLLGNFKEPGLNLAGTLSYENPAHAQGAADELLGARKNLGKFDLLLAALRIAPPIEKIEAQRVDKDTQVVVELNGEALSQLMEHGDAFAGVTEGEQWLPN